MSKKTEARIKVALATIFIIEVGILYPPQCLIDMICFVCCAMIVILALICTFSKEPS